MGVRYQKYRSIAIPLNIGIELSQVSRYFDISNIEPALVYNHIGKMFCCLCDQPTVGKEQSSAIPNNRAAQIAREDGTRTSCGRTSARSVLMQRQHLQITAQVSQTANVRVLSPWSTLLGLLLALAIIA